MGYRTGKIWKYPLDGYPLNPYNAPMRITSNRLNARIAFINRILNRPSCSWDITTGKANIGNLHIINTGYGYQVCEVVNESGGVSTVFPSQPAGQLFAVLGGMMEGIKARKAVDESYASACGF